ncbi:expressed unknown protein [Seminavis robusta]|uniref:Uncharacterized protein n=1 Tax=Seminavis robusta TaxID=568900 RepID=A0A9N8D9J6_9STRA|nr:expressed unknown protein [Seminavis robusta]|eukprot:Sro53_g031280.1 n/a (101) ;mRNA; r:17683-17985
MSKTTPSASSSFQSLASRSSLHSTFPSAAAANSHTGTGMHGSIGASNGNDGITFEKLHSIIEEALALLDDDLFQDDDMLMLESDASQDHEFGLDAVQRRQ